MDESIGGFLHRLFSLHGHRTPPWLIRALSDNPRQLARDELMDQFFDLPSDAAWLWAQRMLKSATPEPWRSRSTSSPRLCPRCLVEWGHHAAYWALPWITVCPRHRTQLRERCLCGRTLYWATLDMDWHCLCRRSLLDDDTAEPTALNCRLSEVIIRRAQQAPWRLSAYLAWLHFGCQLMNRLQASKGQRRGPQQHLEMLSLPLPQLRQGLKRGILATYAQPDGALIYLHSENKPLTISRWISRHDLGHTRLMTRYITPLLRCPTPLNHDQITLNPAIPAQAYQQQLYRLWSQWQHRPRPTDLPQASPAWLKLRHAHDQDQQHIRLRLQLLNQWLADGIQSALPLFTALPDLPGNDGSPTTLIRQLDRWLGQLRRSSLEHFAQQVFATNAKESQHVALSSHS
jgi:hypothetical protein